MALASPQPLPLVRLGAGGQGEGRRGTRVLGPAQHVTAGANDVGRGGSRGGERPAPLRAAPRPAAAAWAQLARGEAPCRLPEAQS